MSKCAGHNIATLILIVYLWNHFNLPWLVYVMAFMAGMIVNLIAVAIDAKAKP